jgi:glycosyltransferase involved in cell wall biosynthesis
VPGERVTTSDRARVAGTPRRPGIEPLRVTYVTARYLPETGGTEIHTDEVARRISDRGASVTVVSTTRDPSVPRYEADGQLQVRRVRAWPRDRDYFFAPALPSAIRRSAPDLLHCQGYHTLVAPLAMWTALQQRIPYIVTFHSGGHSSRLRALARPAQGRLLRPLLVRARALVAVSQFEADLFAERLDIAPDRFWVIPSGIDLPTASRRAVAVDRALIVSVGRVESYKGHDRIIQALPTLRRREPGVRLRILGSGPHEPQLRRLAMRLAVGDIVEIAPVTGNRAELADVLGRAGVVTAFSAYESQGLAVQEAIGLGRPVVVREGSALDELRGHPNVHTVAAGADAEAVAEVVSRVMRAPPAPAPAMPTWDACVDALAQLYRATTGRDLGSPGAP